MSQHTVTTICKAIVYIVSVIVWAYVFMFLVTLGPPIWGVLQLITTTICVISYGRRANKIKKLSEQIEQLNKRIEELEKKNQ